MKRGVGLVMVWAMLMTAPGCATFAPPTMDGPCRDSASGRFISCPTGGGGDGLTAALVLIGVAAVGGLIYLIGRAVSSSGTAAPVESGDRHACLDDHGQTVMLSAGQTCAKAGYTDAPAVPAAAPVLTPSAVRPAATHRCRHPNGDLADFAADQPCAAAGYTDAPRGPRMLRCYDRAGMVMGSTGASCEAAGLRSAPAP